MNPAEIAALLADLGARIEGAQAATAAIEGQVVLVRFDTTEAEALRSRIATALESLGRVSRIDVEIGEVLVQGPIHGKPGAPVAVWIHGPYALDRLFSGLPAVLEIVGPPSRRAP